MNSDSNAPVTRIDTGKTSNGVTFTIRRKARPSRRFQKPRITGETLECPFCDDLHNVLEYTVRGGKNGERKVRTWRCPKTGTLSLNMGRKFQSYVDSITVKEDSFQGERAVPKKSTNGTNPVAADPGKVDTLRRELEARHEKAVKKLEEVVEDG